MVSSGPLVVLSVGSPGQPVIVVPLGGNTKARVVNLQAEGGGLYRNQRAYEFIGFGAMDVTKPYSFIGFGAMDVAKHYEFIGFGAQ